MAWHEKMGVSALLRLTGVGILAIACFAVTALRNRVAAGAVSSDPWAYLLAAAAFLCASFGSLLTVLGRHIFERVRVSRRWSRIDQG